MRGAPCTSMPPRTAAPIGRRGVAGRAALPPCRSVLMVGTDLAGIGGIRAVVQGYIDGGLFERVDSRYIATHRYGPVWVKIGAALRGWLRVAVLVHTMPAPLVHVHLASRASFWRKSVVCLLARLAGRPYLLHVHGGEFLQFYQLECGPIAQRAIRTVFAHAALLIALSEQWRGRLLKICPGAPVEVLTNAVAIPDLEEVLPLRKGGRTVLFLGDLSRGKGAYDLARAFAQVAGGICGSRLVYGGRGELEMMRRLAAELGLEERIACLGWLDRDAKNAALAGATVFVLPSYAEGMPMALLEAMAWGLPVITTPVGGIPQVVTGEVNGLLVPPGNVAALAAALGRVLEDAMLRERLGRAARETVATRFALDAAIDRLCVIYRGFGIPECNAAEVGP